MSSSACQVSGYKMCLNIDLRELWSFIVMQEGINKETSSWHSSRDENQMLSKLGRDHGLLITKAKKSSNILQSCRCQIFGPSQLLQCGSMLGNMHYWMHCQSRCPSTPKKPQSINHSSWDHNLDRCGRIKSNMAMSLCSLYLGS